MPKNLYYTNGRTLKGIDLPQYRDSAWEWITDKPDDTNAELLYSTVSAVFRVATMTSEAIANLPFSIYKGDNEIDSSENWQNAVGFLPRPRELLRLWRLSLFMTNSAYGFMDGNTAIKNLRYIKPDTITPTVDKMQGLVGFKRRIGTEEMKFKLEDRRILYMWRRDHTTELLPSEHTEFKALMAAANVLYYSDYFVQNFFQRGGIKPTMLMVKGIASPQDREKIESLWDKVVHGWSKYLGKIFNAESIEPIPIGEGIENVKDSQLHNDKLSDVAMAAGMPLSLLLANSANYATAQTEYNAWFRDSVIPWAEFMAECLNEQVFTPLGLHFEFKPELSEQGQSEEVERATAYRNYVEAGMKPSVAAQITGIDLPPEIEYEQLDADYAVMKKQPAPESELASAMPALMPPLMEDEKSVPTLLTIDQLRELELWQSFALRKLKQGKSLAFPFVCKVVPEELAATIRGRLPGCKSEEDIIGAFELTPRDDDGLKELAAALNAAVEKFVEVA